jgi:hypothetical protein
MIDQVDQTLKLWRASGFIWGDTDCMLSIGDHIARCGGQDVTGEFRHTYDDERGAVTTLEASGGPCALIERTGLFSTETPVRGSIVVADWGGPVLASLCTGQGVAARLMRGVAEIDLRFVKIIKAWSCLLF